MENGEGKGNACEVADLVAGAFFMLLQVLRACGHVMALESKLAQSHREMQPSDNSDPTQQLSQACQDFVHKPDTILSMTERSSHELQASLNETLSLLKRVSQRIQQRINEGTSFDICQENLFFIITLLLQYYKGCMRWRILP